MFNKAKNFAMTHIKLRSYNKGSYRISKNEEFLRILALVALENRIRKDLKKQTFMRFWNHTKKVEVLYEKSLKRRLMTKWSSINTQKKIIKH